LSCDHAAARFRECEKTRIEAVKFSACTNDLRILSRLKHLFSRHAFAENHGEQNPSMEMQLKLPAHQVIEITGAAGGIGLTN